MKLKYDEIQKDSGDNDAEVMLANYDLIEIIKKKTLKQERILQGFK